MKRKGRHDTLTLLGSWSLLMTLHFILHHTDVTKAQSIVLYQRSRLCPVEALSSEAKNGSFGVKSKVQCASLCLQDLSCRSFLYYPENGLCYLGFQPPSSANYSVESVAPAPGLLHYDMLSSCRNGGVPEMDGSCTCPLGFIGDDCTIVMKDCYDGYYKGNLKDSGVYWIYPTLSPEPFPAYCRMVTRPRTYVMTRNDNDVNFTRHWQDYKVGFGNISADHWIGLDKVHILTNSEDYELRFRVRLRNGSNLFQFYKYVKVENEEHDYRITFDPEILNGTLGDSFSPSNGSYFSTPDRDNDDNDELHCAGLHQGGFWFKGPNCTLCNPTGPMLQPEDELRLGVPEEAFWIFDLGQTVPYKLTAFLVNVIK